MLYRTMEIDELISDKDAKREIIDLMENNGAHLKLISLKKHEEIEAHMSHTDVCLIVNDGEIELIFYHDNNCTCQSCGCQLTEEHQEEGKKYKVKKGQIFFFEKNIMHSVKALKDSCFLLIKI